MVAGCFYQLIYSATITQKVETSRANKYVALSSGSEVCGMRMTEASIVLREGRAGSVPVEPGAGQGPWPGIPSLPWQRSTTDHRPLTTDATVSTQCASGSIGILLPDT